MSTVEEVLPTRTGRPLSTTEKNWLLGLAVAVGLVALFTLVAWLERDQADRKARFVWDASETSTRFLAIAHTVVATVFLLTSKRMKGAKGATWFSGLTALGIALCLGFWALGGKKEHNPIGYFFFYTYFLAHEIRDELFFYRVNGDVPKGDSDASLRSLWLAPLVAFGVIAATFVAGAAFGIGGARRYASAIEDWTSAARIALGVLVILVTAGLLGVASRRYGRLHPGGWRALVSHHRPIFVVFAMIYLLLMVGIAATGKLYAIVAVHVAIWYVFTLRQLLSRPAPSPRPRPFTWTWVRTTAAGFNAFHLGVLALVVSGAVYRALALQNAPVPEWLSWAVSKESFPYWTLMHVTWSWVPRG